MEKLVGRRDAYYLHLLPFWLFHLLPNRAVEGKVSKGELERLHRNLHPTVTAFAEDRHCLHFLSRSGALRGSSVGGLPMKQNGRGPSAQ